MDVGISARQKAQTRSGDSGLVPAQRAAFRHAAPPGARGVRLTRRGRIVVAALLILVAAALVVLISQPGQAADKPGSLPTTVVQPGDTLWDIAGAHAPHRNRLDTIADIKRLNDLHTARLRPGQRLILPK